MAQDLVNSEQTANTMLYSGNRDPSVHGSEAMAGTLYLGTGIIGGKLWQKQDDGFTTNWALQVNVKNFLSAFTVTTTFYVDVNRVDSYVETGSIAAPFKTIQAAINKMNANNDNTLTHGYCLILANGLYAENLLLDSGNGNNGIVNLTILGNGATLQPASGPAFQYNSHNPLVTNSLQQFYCSNLTINGDVNWTALQNGDKTGSIECWYQNCVITGTFTASGITSVAVYDGWIVGPTNITNVAGALWLEGTSATGVVTLVYDATQPDSGGKCVLDTYNASTLQNVIVGPGCKFNMFAGSKQGSFNVAAGSTVDVQNGGTFNASGSAIFSNIHIENGGTFLNAGSWFVPTKLTVDGGGVVTNASDVAIWAYNPADLPSWNGTAPANTAVALDRLAAKVGPVT